MVRSQLPWNDVSVIAITHFHTDHVGGIPELFWAFCHGLPSPRTGLLTVLGPVGTRAFFRKLRDAFGSFILDPGFPVVIDEAAPDTPYPDPNPNLVSDSALTFLAHDTPHTEESLAWRLHGPGWAFGYTGDTGPSQALGRFMRGVDVLVTECSLADDDEPPNHLTPTSVVEIARLARPRDIVLTHVYPDVRESVDVVHLVERAGYAARVQLATEGMRVTLTQG